MKTLDEVIYWYENRKSLLVGKATRDEMEEDILYYLKKYRAEQQENPALTWDELKQMEGKPVWVEFLNDDPWANSWWVVGEVRKDDIIIAQYLDEAELCEEDLGNVWQAY